MYCKKCKFHAFDHVSTCPKCGADWEESRKALYLNWITASGVNWIAQTASGAQQAPASKPAPASRSATAQRPAAAAMAATTAAKPATLDSDPLLDTLTEPSGAYTPAPATPPRSAAREGDIDVSSFPELDFSSGQPAAPKPSQPVSKPSEDLFIEPLPAEDVIELDFSAPTEAPPAPKPAAPAKPKREDLFIPELEEMLAPLTDEPRPTPKKPVFTAEKDILLDFGSTGNGTPGSDTDYLDLDEPKKS